MKPGSYKRISEAREKMRKASLRYYQNLAKNGIPFPRCGQKHTIETKEKMRQAMYARLKKLKEEGKPHFLKGRKIPKEQKKKMSLAKIGKRMGTENPVWKGGKKMSMGYIYILAPDHAGANSEGYVAEHRIVMEKMIGRLLSPKEIIHHKNGDKKDNRPENLRLFESNKAHSSFHQIHKFCPHCKKYIEICPYCRKHF